LSGEVTFTFLRDPARIGLISQQKTGIQTADLITVLDRAQVDTVVPSE
jgi:hypothetical protein